MRDDREGDSRKVFANAVLTGGHYAKLGAKVCVGRSKRMRNCAETRSTRDEFAPEAPLSPTCEI